MANDSGVDILLIRTGNAWDREEAIQRVHLSLVILEEASSQGPGIQRGIVTIRSQLDLATKGDRTTTDASQAPDRDPAFGTVVSQPQASAWLGVDDSFNGALWDHQLLLDVLGAAPISTENPFSFAEGADDGLWAL